MKESETRAKSKFRSEKYDQIAVVMPKGARDELKKRAAADGISLNRYILEAIEQRSGLNLTLDNTLPWFKGE